MDNDERVKRTLQELIDNKSSSSSDLQLSLLQDFEYKDISKDEGQPSVEVTIITSAPAIVKETGTLELLKKELEKKVPGVHTTFRLSPGKKMVPPEREPEVIRAPRPSTVVGKFINPAFTFEKFIVGEPNRNAIDICQEIAREPKKNKRVILIYSKPALGKTHVVTAIANYIRENVGSTSVYFFKKNDFFEECIKQNKSRKTTQFIDNLISANVLIFDDVQMLFDTTKPFFLDVFYHALDIRTTGSDPKTTIFTSDRPLSKYRIPIGKSDTDQEIGIHFEIAEEGQQFYKIPAGRITTRIESGRVIEIGAPTTKMKEQYILQSLESESIGVDQEAMEKIVFMASKGPSDFRALNILCNAVIGEVQKGIDLSKALIRTVNEFAEKKVPVSAEGLKNINNEVRQTYIESIVRDVTGIAQLSVDTIIRKGRIKEPWQLFVRDTILYVLRQHLELTNPEIAAIFGCSPSLVCNRVGIYKNALKQPDNQDFYERILQTLRIKDQDGT